MTSPVTSSSPLYFLSLSAWLKGRKRRASFVLIVLILLVFSPGTIQAFSIDAKITGSRRLLNFSESYRHNRTSSRAAAFSSGPRGTSTTRANTSLSQQSGSDGIGVTSTLISQLAIIALKLRLADQSAVACDVTASSSTLLLRGQVGPVTVKGRRWKSPLGLTCRAIEATVQTCQLDFSSIVSRRKLVLIEPARGDAMIALNAVDFGNFITHPLLKPPPLTKAGSFEFLKNDVEMDVQNGGAVIFYGKCEGEKWKCTLKRGANRRAEIEVEPVFEAKEDLDLLSSELSQSLSTFFNELVFELDGTFLSFKDMMVNKKSEVPNVMIALKITVHKFPSPGLAF